MSRLGLRGRVVLAATLLEVALAIVFGAESVRDYLYQYSVPTVGLARRSREAARRKIAMGEGMRRVDGMRELFAEFVAHEQAASDDEQRSTNRLSHWAIGLGIAGLAGTALLVGLAFGYLGRGVILPLRRLAAATGRLAAGTCPRACPTRVAATRSDGWGPPSTRWQARSRRPATSSPTNATASSRCTSSLRT